MDHYDETAAHHMEFLKRQNESYNNAAKIQPYDLNQLSYLLAEAKRELGMRKKVYPGLVARQKMTAKQMGNLITLQTAIITLIEHNIKYEEELKFGKQKELFSE